MRRSSLIGAAAALFLILAAAGCGDGGGDSEADIRADLSKTLQGGEDGLDEETADCFADIIIDEVGVEELKDVDLSAEEPPAEIQDEITAAAGRAVDECDISASGG